MIKLYYVNSNGSLDAVRRELARLKESDFEEIVCPETITSSVITPFIVANGERFYGDDEISQYVRAALESRSSFA